MQSRIAVSSADFIRNIGRWQNEALRHPITITHHGRERLVLAAPELFASPGGEGEHPAAVELAQLKLVHAQLLENMEEAVIQLDGHGFILAANSAAAALAARAREDLIGLNVIEAFPKPFAAVLADRAQRVARARKGEAFESGTFDGHHLLVRTAPSGDGVLVICQNATEQHRLRHEREAADALERALRRHERAAVIRIDARGRIDAADDSFCAWSGFVAEELLGHRMADLIPGAERRDFTLMFERVLRDAAADHGPVSLLGKRGEALHCDLALSPILADFIARGAQAVLVRRVAPLRDAGVRA